MKQKMDRHDRLRQRRLWTKESSHSRASECGTNTGLSLLPPRCDRTEGCHSGSVQNLQTKGRKSLGGESEPAIASQTWCCVPRMPETKGVRRLNLCPHLFEIARSEEHTSELQSLRHLVCR